MTELLNPDVRSDLLDSLFSRNNRPDPITDWGDFEWSNDWAVQQSEVTKVITQKSASTTKAPGPDGFGLTLWKKAPVRILEWMKFIFNKCLRSGVSPVAWKRANLALIPKASKPGAPKGRLPKVRPICLLDDIGKAFERIIVENCILAEYESGLMFIDKPIWFYEMAFNLRCSPSSEGDLRAVRTNGGFAFAISLDIRNAFNSVPWRVIRRALRHKGFRRQSRVQCFSTTVLHPRKWRQREKIRANQLIKCINVAVR
ncbi:reverse [Lasius niger]|uniref:Reverse n=1 Tax=Lasius niger TaxID=67767 RepID=A0A0J7MTB3_LASNI|nr:reverse [Lasius niger]